jgi:putative tricarboxylic transport membrane protein
MTSAPLPQAEPHRSRWMRLAGRKDVLAGLMFMAVAVLGLWLSRTYPIGTAVRMGTGYVPRLLCWILLVLGGIVLIQGLRANERSADGPPLRLRPLLLVPLSLVAFALTIESLGIIAAGILLILIGGFASSESRPLEVIATAVALVLFTWGIFIWALSLPIPVWPGG